MTKFSLMSLQARMHRSQRMQAEWSTWMMTDESSDTRGAGRGPKRDAVTPSRAARVSSSQSCVAACRIQGVGCSARSNSTRVARAFRTRSELVWTTMPSSAGLMHAACNTRAPATSTVQTRQTPTGAI